MVHAPSIPTLGLAGISRASAASVIPLAGLGLIMGVDRLLDMSRTAVNVTGDLVAASILDRHARTQTSASEAREQELEHERQRQSTQTDVLILPPCRGHA